MRESDEPMSVAGAARTLGTSAPTVRKLIEQGRLQGTMTLDGGRRRFMTSYGAIQSYLSDFGPFTRRRPSTHQRLDALERAASETRVPSSSLMLREVVRAQSIAIEHLNRALELQEEASQHLRSAEERRAAAVVEVRRAHEAQSAIVSLYGTPDDVSELTDHN